VLADEELKRQAEDRVGTVLGGKWRLDALLGVGGMASVYSATHRNTKRVAVKLLHPHLSYEGTIRERFLREGYAANRVKHPGVVAVHDEDSTPEGAAFLVMELLEGESVSERWQKQGFRLPPEEVMSLADELLDTLAAAHEQGIVHRDIKPENLFLTNDGQLKVLDFGIARLRELSGSISATRTGSMLGTPAFMAPEQAKGRWNEVDALTDLWSVGATMFTLITGDYVHQGNTANEMLALTITQPARSIGKVLPGLHPALVGFVDRSLAYHKHDRWPDARAMRSALKQTRPDAATLPSERFGTQVSPRSAMPTRRSDTIASRIVRLRAVVASILGVFVVGALALLFRPTPKPAEPASGSELASPEASSLSTIALPSATATASVTVVVADAGLSADEDAGAPALAAARAPGDSVRPAKPRRRPAESAPTPAATPKPSGDPFARRR
jgi:serine/threonine-protein kinase